MQKPLHVLFLACLTFSGLQNKAQTLTAANFNPQIGEVFTNQASDYVSPGSSGQGQVWDFRALSNFYQVTVSQILSPTISSSPSSYTNATIANKRGNGIDYFSTGVAGIDRVGREAVINPPVITTYPNPETLVKYPFAYGNSFIDSWQYKTVYTPSTIIIYNGSNTVTADGSGTLITGCATYTNVLRLHVIGTGTNVAQTTITTYTIDNYYWYSPGIHVELFSVLSTTSIAGTNPPSFPKSSNLYNDPSNPIGIKKNSLNPGSFLIYPNPASIELNIKTLENVNGAYSVKLFSATRQLVLEKTSGPENEFAIDVSALQTGIYFATIKTENKLVETKKVIITR